MRAEKGDNLPTVHQEQDSEAKTRIACRLAAALAQKRTGMGVGEGKSLTPALNRGNLPDFFAKRPDMSKFYMIEYL